MIVSTGCPVSPPRLSVPPSLEGLPDQSRETKCDTPATDRTSGGRGNEDEELRPRRKLLREVSVP